jgi:hypothetical protein
MNKLLLLLFISCGTDVSIMKHNDKPVDTSEADNLIGDENNQSNNNNQDTYNTDEHEEQNTDHDLVVGFIEHSFIQASCPQCFGLQSEITTTQYARFHQATGANHYAWVPRSDETCRQYYEAPVSAANIDVGNTMSLSTGNFAYSLNKSYDNTGVVYAGNIQNSDTDYVRDAYYNITIDNESITESQIQSLHGFDYIEPYSMLYTDMTYAYQAQINKTNNTFSWAPYGDENSIFTIHISVYSWDGGSYYGTVICRGNDTGMMTIPGNYFQDYPSGSLTSIHLIRHRINDIYSEKLQGIIQTHVWWEVIGTGHIQ